MHPSIASVNRPLPVTKHRLKLEMEHDRKAFDFKGMRIYDLHRSHVSLLTERSVVYVDGCLTH